MKKQNITGPIVEFKTPQENFFGINGLSQILGCSRATAVKIKRNGLIPFSQIGRKIIFNKTEVLQAIKYAYNGPNKIKNHE